MTRWHVPVQYLVDDTFVVEAATSEDALETARQRFMRGLEGETTGTRGTELLKRGPAVEEEDP